MVGRRVGCAQPVEAGQHLLADARIDLGGTRGKSGSNRQRINDAIGHQDRRHVPGGYGLAIVHPIVGEASLLPPGQGVLGSLLVVAELESRNQRGVRGGGVPDDEIEVAVGKPSPKPFVFVLTNVTLFFQDCGFEVVRFRGLKCSSPVAIAQVQEDTLRAHVAEMDGCHALWC